MVQLLNLCYKLWQTIFINILTSINRTSITIRLVTVRVNNSQTVFKCPSPTQTADIPMKFYRALRWSCENINILEESSPNKVDVLKPWTSDYARTETINKSQWSSAWAKCSDDNTEILLRWSTFVSWLLTSQHHITKRTLVIGYMHRNTVVMTLLPLITFLSLVW